ncbi:MAG: hypothetical protein M3Q06_15645 [Bacteroidota bacterium]|nr:hypothetical protein [Bacteroidota bacterium]
MRRILQLALVLFCVQASAQTKPLRYGGNVQAGLLEGEVGSTFQLQTVNGIQYKTWFAGLGVGLDYYHTRTLPLFTAFRKDWKGGAKTPFVYVNSGYNFPWLRDRDKSWGETNTEGGLYFDAGIGYQLPVLKTSALFFSAGYSEKHFSITRTDGYYIDIWPRPDPRKTVTAYSLRRLSIQTGLRF